MGDEINYLPHRVRGHPAPVAAAHPGDSGVGNSHKIPTITCYFVTKLHKAITRTMHVELSGKYREPSVAAILRTGGNPQAGASNLGADIRHSVTAQRIGVGDVSRALRAPSHGSPRDQLHAALESRG